MSRKWRQSTWGDEIELSYGKAIRNRQKDSGSFRVYGSNGPIGWSEAADVPGPGVVLGRKGAYRGVCFSHEPFSVIDTAYYVSLKKNLDMRWIYYAIIFHKLGEIDDGSPIPSTTRSAVYVRPIEVPPLWEQRSISDILGVFDDKIRLNQKMNETLVSAAQTIFKDWFIEFNPTRSKVKNKNAYMEHRIWDIFPDSFDALGNPAGWRSSTIGEEACLVKGGTPSTKNPDYWNGHIEWVVPKDISKKSSPILLSTDRSITQKGLEKIGSFLAPTGTVLISTRASIGDIAINELPIALGTGITGMVCNRGLSNLYVWLWASQNIELIKCNANGSVFMEISKNDFSRLNIVVPSNDALEAFDNAVKPIYQRIVSNEHENYSLMQTRDLLLSKLISGEIRFTESTGISMEAS